MQLRFPPRRDRPLPSVALVLGLALIQVLAQPFEARGQTAPPSNLYALFNPRAGGRDHVPLSQFLRGDAGETVSFSVRGEIMDHVGAGLLVAERDSDTGVVTLHDPVAVISAGDLQPGASFGVVVHEVQAPQAAAVVVHRDLSNRFLRAPGAPDQGLVTHWNASLNDGRGGWALGWTEGIDTRDFVDAATVEGPTSEEQGLLEEDPSGYFWNTDRFALFTDSTNAHVDARVPGYERYVSEDWSSVAVTKLAAVRFSDYARSVTGIPIAFRNYAEPVGLGIEGRLLDEGYPTFQLLHNFLVRHDDPAHPGSENSLASFFMPPYWERLPAGQDHPVLFNSGYDTDAAAKPGGTGGLFVRMLGELYLEDPAQKVVGVISNGGGGRATVALQGSAIENLNALWEAAGDELSLSRTRIVSTGYSRSGTSELALWSHPDLAPGLSARFLKASSPNTYPGESLSLYGNATYSLIQKGINETTGYADAYTTGWEAPDQPGVTAAERAATVLLGMDGATYDATLAGGSAAAVGRLEARGTTVVLQAGTHDHSRAFAHMIDMADVLADSSVPWRMLLEYRLGHKNTPQHPSEAELLRRVFADEGLAPEELGVFYRHPRTPADEAGPTLKTYPFYPPRTPVFVEAPLVADLGVSATLTVVGPPGLAYELWIYKLNEQAWFARTHLLAADPGIPFKILTGVLPELEEFGEMSYATHPAPASVAQDDVGPWAYLLAFQVPGSPVKLLTSETSVPGDYPSFDFWPTLYIGDLLDPGSTTEALGLDVETRTGGVSDDLIISPPPPQGEPVLGRTANAP